MLAFVLSGLDEISDAAAGDVEQLQSHVTSGRH
jgi:hypothetical protein